MIRLWQKASELAERTPPTRNRYVDFLRAVSIGAVVLGHWLIAAPFYTDAGPKMLHLLDVEPWTHWLTWLFQVMPIFFFVGGYSNFTAWEASRRRSETYAIWLGSRLYRLLYPVLPLLLGWTALAIAGSLAGLPASYIRKASQISMVPTWFLAVYILVVLFVPLTYHGWKRFGLFSIVPLILGAILVDIAFFVKGWRLLSWINYLFIWLTIHQLGYAWREGWLAKRLVMFVVAVCAIGALYVLTTQGPYPIALVGVPSDDVSNTLPPKLPLLLLGLCQIGLFMSIEPWMNRILSGSKAWTATIVVNGMIMTLFLWHSTAMMLTIGLTLLFAPQYLSIEPSSVAWWYGRPAWLAVFGLATLPFLLGFSRFERPKMPEAFPEVGRLFLSCVLTCSGIAYLAMNGIGDRTTWVFDFSAILLVLCGMATIGFGPLRIGKRA